MPPVDRDARPEKLDILYLPAERFPPYRVDVAELFGCKLAERGHRIDWLMQAASPGPAKKASWGGGTAYVAANYGSGSALAKLHSMFAGYLNDFRSIALALRRRYQFIQVKDKLVAALPGILAAKLSRAKFTYWLSYPFPEAAIFRARNGLSPRPRVDQVRGWLMGLLLYKVICRLSDHVFVQSEQMRQDLISRGVPTRKMTPVPMGVALDRVQEVMDIERGKQPSLIYIGDLGRTRHLDFLLRVFALVVEKIPDARLLLVGAAPDPGDVDQLMSIAADLDLRDSVQFPGFLPMNEAWKLVRQSWVGVSPLHPSPMFQPASSTKPIEYMALERPVVANGHADQAQIIADSGAGICVPYEEQPFADAIIGLIKNPRQCAEMGQCGRRYVEYSRSYETIAAQIEQTYRDLVGSTSPTRGS